MNVVTRDEAIELGLKFYYTGKPCKHGHDQPRWVTSFNCIVCAKDQCRINKAKRYAKNPEKYRELGRLDYSRNPERYKMHACFRSKRLKQATPPWVTKEMMKPFYDERNRLTKETGIPHDIDHIWPLKSPDDTFCGLNVPANLQVIPASVNRSKQNRYFGARYSRSTK